LSRKGWAKRLAVLSLIAVTMPGMKKAESRMNRTSLGVIVLGVGLLCSCRGPRLAASRAAVVRTPSPTVAVRSRQLVPASQVRHSALRADAFAQGAERARTGSRLPGGSLDRLIVLVPVDGRRVATTRQTRAYRVRRGDTLAKLSHKFYGTSAHWKRIWRSNRTLIPSPDRLKHGLVITVPNL
jgi:nucleoid-associated protein YgaU